MNQVFDNYLFDAFANASDNIYVYVTDIDTGITRWSPRAVHYFNLENEYLSNVKETWTEYIHPDDREVYRADIGAVFSGASTNHHCQYRARNRHGEYVWVECRGSIIYDDFGNPKVFAGIMTRLDNPNKYDPLTHLLSGYEFFNRPLMQDGVMMMVGIDGLRSINSQHGILYGNKALRYMGEVLAKSVPEGTVFRYFGNDFIVTAYESTTQKMMNVFRQVQQTCAGTSVSQEVHGFPISAGIVCFKKEENLEDLIRRAEVTVSCARKLPSHVTVYSAKIEKELTRQQAISEALTRSIQQGFEGFHLVFQPVVFNDSRVAGGCEALLRWDPKIESIGRCSPDEFIPILEKNGGIIEVGSFVMREAIRQTALLQKKHPGLKVSLNASYYQMQDPGFAQAVVEEIAQYGLDPACVIVELTESVLIDDTGIVKDVFDYLHKHGVLIALDDFGRGNSSFWMLHNLHVDYIKLDQAFIRTLNRNDRKTDCAIIESTVQLCRNIGSKAVAEGIEDESVYGLIREMGFDHLQGFLFSRPLTPEALDAFLDEQEKKARAEKPADGTAPQAEAEREI